MKSAERLLAVLELLAKHGRPVPTMAIARECGIPKSGVHRLLNVMRARHFVTYYEVERAWGRWVRATIGAPPQMALLRGVLTHHEGAP